jgi:predicted transcriptional regulator
MRVAKDLNPDALRRPQAKNKVCSDKEFLDAVLGEKPKTYGEIIKEAECTLKMSSRSAARYLNRLTEAGLVRPSSGLYWRTE